MNDEQRFEDLKRFVANTVSQSVTASEERLVKRIDKLEKKMDDGFAGIGESIDNLGDDLDKRFATQNARLDDHQEQLGQLKKRAA